MYNQTAQSHNETVPVQDYITRPLGVITKQFLYKIISSDRSES